MILNSAPAVADTPRALIDQGNEHFEAGCYADALEAYDQIGDEPDAAIAAELLHDRAAAHFKLGQIDEARELWVRAAGLKDEAFEAAARYNLGNCDYGDALQAFQAQDANAALELLDRALQQYRDALRLDPTLLDARANLELAARLKKQIEEMTQQRPQSQPSSQPGPQDRQQDRSSSQPSESGQQDQSESDSESQQRDEQSKEDEDQEREQQDSSQQPDSQPVPESQPSPQPPPEAAAQQDQQQEQQPVPIEMTREEAERLLQMIRDAERQRRAILRAREAAGQKPVEKDW